MKPTLRNFIELQAATRPDGVGVVCRHLLKSPPDHWNAAALRRWTSTERESDSVERLIEEWFSARETAR